MICGLEVGQNHDDVPASVPECIRACLMSRYFISLAS